MPWTGGPNGGFTGAARPWEPLQPGHEARNVATQNAATGSLLDYYRRLVRLRQSEPALTRGSVQSVETGRSDVIAWQRALNGRRLMMIANLSGTEIRDYRLPGTADLVFIAQLIGGTTPDPGGGLTLAPHGAYLLVQAEP